MVRMTHTMPLKSNLLRQCVEHTVFILFYNKINQKDNFTEKLGIFKMSFYHVFALTIFILFRTEVVIN